MAHIEIPAASSRQVIVIGATPVTSVMFNLPFFSEGDLSIYIDGAPLSAGYSVEPNTNVEGGYAGGKIVFDNAVANARIVISRKVAIERVTDFPVTGTFDIQKLNTEFDKLYTIVQDSADDMQRAFKAPAGTALTSLDIGALQAGYVVNVASNQDGVITLSATDVSLSDIQLAAQKATEVTTNAATVANNLAATNTALAAAKQAESGAKEAQNKAEDALGDISQVIKDGIADASVTTPKLAPNAVTLSKLANGTAGKFIGFDGDGNAAEVDVVIPEIEEDLATLMPNDGDLLVRDGDDFKAIPKGDKYEVLTMKDGKPTWERPLHVANVPTTSHGRAGYRRGAVVLSDGTIRMWGNNEFASQGHGRANSFTGYPHEVAYPPNTAPVREIYARSHTMFSLHEDGSLFGWGYNSLGNLGVGDTTQRNVPTQINFPSGVKIKKLFRGSHSVDWGHETIVALAEDGRAWAWGNVHHGSLGNGSAANVNQTAPFPLALEGQSQKDDWVDFCVAGGNGNSVFAIDSEGKLYSWGYGAGRILGHGGTADVTRITHLDAFGGKKIVKISAQAEDDPGVNGGQYWGAALALDEDGYVWSWGTNDWGQLGVTGFQLSPVRIDALGNDNIDILMANGHVGQSYVVKSDGRVFSAGYNLQGQLGHGDTSNNIRLHREMVGSKRDDHEIVQMLQIGDTHIGNGIAILYSDGVIMACGRNKLGRLGLGHQTVQTTLAPVLGIQFEKPVKLTSVGTYVEACLGVLTEEGSYYQTAGESAHRQLPYAMSDDDEANILIKVPLT